MSFQFLLKENKHAPAFLDAVFSTRHINCTTTHTPSHPAELIFLLFHAAFCVINNKTGLQPVSRTCVLCISTSERIAVIMYENHQKQQKTK